MLLFSDRTKEQRLYRQHLGHDTLVHAVGIPQQRCHGDMEARGGDGPFADSPGRLHATRLAHPANRELHVLEPQLNRFAKKQKMGIRNIRPISGAARRMDYALVRCLGISPWQCEYTVINKIHFPVYFPFYVPPPVFTFTCAMLFTMQPR